MESRTQKRVAGGQVALAGVAMLLAVGLSLWLMRRASSLEAGGGIVSARDNRAIMEPEKWVDKPLPILPYLKANAGGDPTALGRGSWRVVIYSNRCTHCRTSMPRALGEAASSPASVSWAFIELPPYAPAGEELVPATAAGPRLMRLRLSDDRKWFTQTPVVMRMQDGIVKTVTVQGEDRKRGDIPHSGHVRQSAGDPQRPGS